MHALMLLNVAGAHMQTNIKLDPVPINPRTRLYEHLNQVVLPEMGIELKCPEFNASRFNPDKDVYLFEEAYSRSRFVGKFFGFRLQLTAVEQENSLNNEFKNLSNTRENGLVDFPNRIVRPLSKDEQSYCLLVEDYVRGHDLDYYIAKAAHEGQHNRLLRKLTLLGRFLCILHRQKPGVHQICRKNLQTYFHSMVDSLNRRKRIDDETALEFSRMITAWQGVEKTAGDEAVLVHGDANPTNFFFHPEDGVTAIDLERMHCGDRVYDLGFLAAELKHHFAWRIHDANISECFIDHLLHAYCEGFEDASAVFREISARNPFYMALGEIRIARNSWLPEKHRAWLIGEALRCLKR